LKARPPGFRNAGLISGRANISSAEHARRCRRHAPFVARRPISRCAPTRITRTHRL